MVVVSVRFRTIVARFEQPKVEQQHNRKPHLSKQETTFKRKHHPKLTNKKPLLFLQCADIRHLDLIHETAETQTELGGDLLHGTSQLVPQQTQLLLIVVHRPAQVHEIIQIDRIVFGLSVRHVDAVRLLRPQFQIHPLRRDLHDLSGTHSSAASAAAPAAARTARTGGVFAVVPATFDAAHPVTASFAALRMRLRELVVGHYAHQVVRIVDELLRALLLRGDR